MGLSDDTCAQGVDVARRRISDFLLQRYDGRKGVTVYVNKPLIDPSRYYGSTKLFGDKAETPECNYSEPSILMVKDGQVCTVIDIDNHETSVLELAGKAMAPLLSTHAEPSGERKPLRSDVHVVQVICTLAAPTEMMKWECRYRSLENDICSIYRNMGKECRYSLVMPVKRDAESVEKVLTNCIENKLW